MITTYTVCYLDSSDESAIADQVVKEGGVGKTITVYAKTIEGYRPLEDEKTITLAEKDSDNIIKFFYEEADSSNDIPAASSTVGETVEEPVEEPSPVNITYEVTCVDSEGQVLLRESYTDTEGTTVTVSPPAIEGYTTNNGDTAITLDQEADNSIVFVYEPVVEEPSVNIPFSNILGYNGHTYFAYETSAIDTYREAEEYCESLGGHLAVINDDDENTALYDYVFKHLGLPSAYFGLSDENQEDSWEWIDGTPYSYENWLSGEPDNQRGVEDYALFYYKDTAYTWNDGDFGKDPTTGTVIFLIEWETQQ